MAAPPYSEAVSPDFGRSSSPGDNKKDFLDDSLPIPEAADDGAPPTPVRPEIDYSSVGAFWASLWRRFASIWTKRFILSLLAGQVVSLCITCTNVTTTELVNRNWSLPTTQTFFL